MVDKEQLYERLAKMANLSDDWDGFGTVAISSSVHRITGRLIEYLDVDSDKDSIKIFVGVNTPGSVFMEVIHKDKTFEFTITIDGTIFYEEIVDNVEIGSGIFLLSKKKLDEILK